MAPPLIQLKDIRLTFGGTQLLSGVELSVSSGERVCLIGRNGSGKSTLLKIAAGIVESDGGSRFVQPGATIRYLYGVIVSQAVISAVIGYGFGMVVSYFVVRGSEQGGAAILLPVPMAAAMLVLTLAMCVGAAVVSINKVTRLDPAMVFTR